MINDNPFLYDDATPLVLVAVLGSLRLLLGGAPLGIPRDSKSEGLLISLALAKQHGLPRIELLERLWPDYNLTLAGQSLNSLTYQLNKRVADALNGAGLIIHDNGYYCLNTQAGVGVDLDYFYAWYEAGKHSLRQGDSASATAFYQKALVLYKNDLCGDSNIQTVMERERLRIAFLDLLAYLADYSYNQNDYEQALFYIQRLLWHEPCREDAHRQAMCCYLRLNQRTQALRQYRLCCQALNSEFDAQPEPATVALYDQIRLNPASL